MRDDLAAVGGSQRAELSTQTDSARNSSDSLLKTQLKETLLNSRQAGVSPPRIDVVTATDKLQTLSQLLTDPRSSSAIEKLLTHLQTADPFALANPNALDRLLQDIMAPPVPAPPPSPAPRKIERTHGNESTKMGGQKPRIASSTSRERGLSKLFRDWAHFFFG